MNQNDLIHVWPLGWKSTREKSRTSLGIRDMTAMATCRQGQHAEMNSWQKVLCLLAGANLLANHFLRAPFYMNCDKFDINPWHFWGHQVCRPSHFCGFHLVSTRSNGSDFFHLQPDCSGHGWALGKGGAAAVPHGRVLRTSQWDQLQCCRGSAVVTCLGLEMLTKTRWDVS